MPIIYGPGPPGVVKDFYAALQQAFTKAKEKPGSFSIRDYGLRRVGLEKFPYHIAFQIYGDEVQIVVLRHNRRHPGYGMRRRWD